MTKPMPKKPRRNHAIGMDEADVDPVTGEDFRATRGRLFELHRTQDYRAALRLAESAAEEYPERVDQTTYWRACLHALLGEHERAVRVLEDGAASGMWWAPEMLETDPDLARARSDERFRAIVAASADARASAASLPPAEPLIRPPADGPPSAVLVTLHGRGEFVEDSVERWTTAPGALIVAPRSTQPFGMRLACWDDLEVAAHDTTRALEVATRTPALASLPVIVAGYSQGGGVAIALAVKQSLPGCVGFITVAPSTRWVSGLIGTVEPMPSLRGYIVVGDADPNRDSTDRLRGWLTDHGADVRLDVIEGLAHEYPADFDERVPDMVRWALTADAMT